jgi:hypothetical protein
MRFKHNHKEDLDPFEAVPEYFSPKEIPNIENITILIENNNSNNIINFLFNMIRY